MPLEVASNANAVVLGLLVRLSAWGLLVICFWFSRILEKLGATVDDAKTQTKLFFWIFSVDAIITGMQSQGLPSDQYAILVSSAFAFGSILAIYSVFASKLARIGLTGKEMLIVLRKEKENRALYESALKLRPICVLNPRECLTQRKIPLLERENPEMVSSRAPRVSFEETIDQDGDNGGRFLSDVILASMASRPISRVSLRVQNSRRSAPHQHADTEQSHSVHPPSLSTQQPVVPQLTITQQPQQRSSSSVNANDAILASLN